MGQIRRPATDPFSRLIAHGCALLRKGDLKLALADFQSSLSLARKSDQPEQINKALSNISTCFIEMGEYEKATKGLREIILRSSDDETICGASYNLSISLRRLGRYPKAFVYAKKAFEKSKAIGDLNWMARCHNLIGNIYLVQSHLDKALQQYQKALTLRLKEREINRFSVAILRDNIGYCQLLQGQYDKGIQNVRIALDMVTELGSKKCVCECAHDLSFGYMQLRRLDEAEEYGIQALEIAEAEGYKEIIKNCFYLLGEINYLKGNEEQRDHYFYRLQDLYPHLPFLRDFLCTFDVSKIIALRFPQ
ncbi:MAG TPA: tetratricopeptide repeat protein [Patescibacteria group bacterium]|nr:tetratricopeptide repeat protein [Patescibacteria group bacterium]